MSLVGVVLSGRGLWDGLITRPKKSQCDLETSTMRRPWPTGAAGHEKNLHTHTHIYIYIYMCVCVQFYIYIYIYIYILLT